MTILAQSPFVSSVIEVNYDTILVVLRSGDAYTLAVEDAN